MDLGLHGKRALVLGASRGLGRAIADALAAEGCDVWLVARSADRVAEAASAIAAGHDVDVATTALDLGDRDAVAALCREVSEGRGVDILVNNGGGPAPAGALAVPGDDWRRQFDAMVMSLVEVTTAAIPAMQARGWGRVLTIASSGVAQPIPNLAISNTLRAGLVAWSKTLAGEVAADGVTVNVIVPGRIGTERTVELDTAAAERQGLTVEEVRRRSIAAIPAGRVGEVGEFASVAAFLVSARASYVTGSVVRVDGGMIRGL